MEKIAPLFREDCKKLYLIELITLNPSFKIKFKMWLRHFGLHCVAVYRLGQYSNLFFKRHRIIGFPLIVFHRCIDYIVRLLHHVNIDAKEIGAGFYIGHVGNIHIGPTTIGKNFSVTHNVSIGIGHAEGNFGIPTIGDNVWVGTSSVLYGAIDIGNGVTVCSGSILSKSIPECCLVAGNPSRLVKRGYDNTYLFGKYSAEEK